MTTFAERSPFQVRRANKFNLSDHQPLHITTETKKLIPTIIRLAKLMAAVDTQEKPHFRLNDQEELEVQIREFRDLVHKNHFPLLGYEEDEFDEMMAEALEEWIMDDWISDTSSGKYHPLLSSIPVSPMGIPDHDIELEDCYDVVALLYWLCQYDADPPKLKSGLKVSSIWSVDEQRQFKLTPISEILEGMDLKAPLSFLPGLIKTVLHETETFFLDACPLCGGFDGPEFDWTVENFIWFRHDWQKAKPIYEGNERLIGWADQNPERLVEISSILKRAWQIHLSPS